MLSSLYSRNVRFAVGIQARPGRSVTSSGARRSSASRLKRLSSRAVESSVRGAVRVVSSRRFLSSSVRVASAMALRPRSSMVLSASAALGDPAQQEAAQEGGGRGRRYGVRLRLRAGLLHGGARSGGPAAVAAGAPALAGAVQLRGPLPADLG